MTWSYNDIYNVFKTSLGEKEYDATGLVEMLQERMEEKCLRYYISHGTDGRLERVFFEIVS